MKEIEDGFGERLQEERLRLCLTREQLAERTSVSPLSISQYEKGRSIPSIKFIYAINQLQLDVVYILLAIRQESVIHEYSTEMCTRVANEIQLL